ncbi:DIP1984 family protein [bacterium]|nr:DIP1984 family protein [bacterium]
MKLATALTERANLKKKIAELSVRLNNNAKVQEGEAPEEAPEELISELKDCLSRFEDLISRINHTNSVTKIGNKTVTDYIAHRDCLKKHIKIMREFLDKASEKVTRYSKTEIKILSTVSVSELQKEVDRLSKELRETDEKIQEVNWTTELL